MIHRSFRRVTTYVLAALASASFAAVCALPANADEEPTNNGPLTQSEQQFIASVKADLMRRFPHASDAEKAGYVRYTGVDDTGAISYENNHWNSDPTHPSQLWYDVSGNLMGADFSVPRPHGEGRPSVWGVDPGRWDEEDGHVHFVVKNPDTGKMLYGLWIWNADFAANGGDVNDPSAETLVKIGRVPSVSSVQTIFEYPTQWDLIVWLRPHSTGLFHW
jgi:hypothetical protein